MLFKNKLIKNNSILFYTYLNNNIFLFIYLLLLFYFEFVIYVSMS